MSSQMRRRQFDHFGFVAGIYDRVITTSAAERLAALARLTPADRLLDAGGGTGRVATQLRPHVGHLAVLDLSYGMLRQAVRKGFLAPCQGVAEALPFADATFTKIVAVDTLHHFGSQADAALELLRVLAPGGCLVVEEPDIRQLVVKLVALGEKLALMRSRFLPPDVVADLFLTPMTSVRVVEEPPNYWVVVDKHARGE
jgi:ubiquinone/menaquinone biosynthesis C-methylase UbiE